MLRKLDWIKGCGFFEDYRWQQSLPELARITVIYGGNGTGKTSLAGALDGLRNPPENEGFRKLSLTVADIPEPRVTSGKDDPIFDRIHVFSEHYVARSHLFTPAGSEMAAVLTIGEKPVDAEKQLNQFREQAKQTTQDRDAAVTAERKANQEIDTAFGRVSEQVVDANMRAGGRWKSRSNFNAGVVRRTFDGSHATWVQLSDEELKERVGVVNSGKEELLPEIAHKPVVPDDLASRADRLLAAAPTSVMLDSLKTHPEATSWVDSGRHLHADSDTCIFCGSALTPQRRAAIDGHFSDEVERLKKGLGALRAELRTLEQHAEASARGIPSMGLFFEDLRPRYAQAVDPLRDELLALQRWAVDTGALVDKKQANVLGVVSQEITAPPEVSGTDFVALRTEHNRRVEQRVDLVMAAAEAIELHYLKKAEPGIKSKQDEAATEREKAEKFNQALAELNSKIVALGTLEGDPVPTAKVLTQEVARLLGRSELVFEAEGDRYRVTRNGAPAVGLSMGERAAITLVHFLEMVARCDNTNGKPIVVIDDPVSSLDSNIFMGISTYIWTEAISKQHINQLVLLTHNFELFRQWDIQIEALHQSGRDAQSGTKLSELYPAVFLELQASHAQVAGVMKRQPMLAVWPPSELARRKVRSTYHHGFIAIAAARKSLLADDSLENRLDAQLLFPNVIRRTLETFLAFKRPEWVGNFNAAMRNSEQLLKDAGFDGDWDALRNRLTRYSHAYSHSETPATDVVVSPEEVSTAIGCVFEFMSAIDPDHFAGLCEVVGLQAAELLPASSDGDRASREAAAARNATAVRD